MTGVSRLLLLLSTILRVFLCTSLVNGKERTLLPNLREFEERGTYGRFMVPIGPLSDDFQRRKGQNNFCGNDVQLDIPEPDAIMEPNDEAEVNIVLFQTYDSTLNRELSCDMKEHIALSNRGVGLLIPYVSGSENGVVTEVTFVDEELDIFHPYVTNMDVIKRVDSIEETDDGIVSLYKGDDVMMLKIEQEVECGQKQDDGIEQNMDELVGKSFHATSYPMQFDFWGCSSLNWNVSFCQVLKDHQCEIQRVGGDICIQAKITHAHYCPASMTLVNATGYFRDEMRFFSSFPLMSFAADSYRKQHSNGIIFPCLI